MTEYRAATNAGQLYEQLRQGGASIAGAERRVCQQFDHHGPLRKARFWRSLVDAKRRLGDLEETAPS
jgi:hypothetical protein